MRVFKIISLININKIYKSTKIKALNSINLEIEQEEILGILGPNGAGKTTLIKVLCYLVAPDEGSIKINENLVTKYNYRKHLKNIGVVLEGARNLYWNITVKDNFYYFAALKGKNVVQTKDSIDFYSELFDVSGLLNRKIKTISLGQKQKVAIMASMLHNPKLLILDEPSNGIDIEAKENLIEILKRIKTKYKTSILITSHDVDFIRKVTDRFIVMNNGIIKESFINDNMSNDEIEGLYKVCTK